MILSEIRAEARRKLEGKWGKAVSLTLAYSFIFFVIGFIEGLFSESAQRVLQLITFVIEVPLVFGLIISLIKLYNNEDVKAFDVFTLGFNNFGKSWSITFKIFLKMLVPVILLIVSYFLITFGLVSTVSASLYSYSAASGFSAILIVGLILLIVSAIWTAVKSYYYQLSYIIAVEKPELSANDVVLRSKELMTGKRGKLFLLQLSFIGWSILSVLTFGIGFLWLIPYINFAVIVFYKSLTDNSSGVKVEIENDSPIKGE